MIECTLFHVSCNKKHEWQSHCVYTNVAHTMPHSFYNVLLSCQLYKHEYAVLLFYHSSEHVQLALLHLQSGSMLHVQAWNVVQYNLFAHDIYTIFHLQNTIYLACSDAYVYKIDIMDGEKDQITATMQCILDTDSSIFTLFVATSTTKHAYVTSPLCYYISVRDNCLYKANLHTSEQQPVMFIPPTPAQEYFTVFMQHVHVLAAQQQDQVVHIMHVDTRNFTPLQTHLWANRGYKDVRIVCCS